jgi:hypothetical protein
VIGELHLTDEFLCEDCSATFARGADYARHRLHCVGPPATRGRISLGSDAPAAFERPDRPGYFRAFVELPPGPDGQRRRRTVNGKSREKVLERLGVAASAGTDVPPRLVEIRDQRPAAESGSACGCSDKLAVLRRAARDVVESQMGNEMWQSIAELRAVLREIERDSAGP